MGHYIDALFMAAFIMTIPGGILGGILYEERRRRKQEGK